MKKNVSEVPFHMRKGIHKAFLFMKISFILILATCLQVSAKSYSQGNTSLTLDLTHVKLKKAINVISRKVNCRFLYSEDIVPVNKRVNLNVKDQPLSSVMENLLRETGLKYEILDNGVIVIAEKGTIIQQQHTVTGIIKDEQGNPLAGVTVQVKGANTGTVTSVDGQFKLEVPDNAILVFSSVGFETQEVSTANKSELNIILHTSSKSLSELVVTGYTTQIQKNLTGSVSTVKGSDLTAIPMGNAQKQLQGKVSGVNITTSGEPGGGSKVRIRGFGSFTSNDPLYVVDGVPTTDISSIDPNDISDISVLKDAATASIYGARAFAGVILITTKKGKAGKLTVNYDVSYGNQYPGHGFDLMNPQQTAEWTWKAMEAVGDKPSHPQYGSGAEPVIPDYIMAGTHYGLLNSDPNTAALVDPSLYNIDPSKGPFYQIVKANKAGTNWYKEITRVAPIQNHNLSLSGGSDNSRYSVQMGYYNQQGVVMETYLKRYTLRANTEFTIHNRVKIGENVQVALRDNPTLGNGDIGGSEGNAIGWSYRENPLIPVHDIMGNFAGTRADGFNNPHNPVADQYRTKDNRTHTTDIFGNIYMDVLLPYNLTFHSSFGGGYSNYYYNTFGYLQYEDKENNPTVNYVYEGANYQYNWVWTNTLQFEHQYGDHYIKVLLGEEALGGQARNVDVSGFNPFSPDPNYATISTTQSSGRTATDGGGPLARTYSLFAQANYNYKDKYLLSGTVRRDGSAVFGPEHRFGVFPAVSAGWRISSENFMQNTRWINDLKIRGSYGEMGNSTPVPLKNQVNTYAASPEAASYDIFGTDNSLEEGLRADGFAAPATHWETNKTLDFGLDATLFNNAFDLTVDWYKRNTVGLLYAPQVEATVGFLNDYPTVNVGSMKNVGVDLQISKHGNFATNWRYDATLNFSTYKNTITKIADNIDYFYGNSYGATRIGGNPTINKVGHSMSAFYGYKVVGLWQSEDEIKAADEQAQKALGNPDATYQDGGEQPGEFRYKDVDGNGYIDNDDRMIFGNPNPDFTYGITASIGYKNFDLRLDFYGVWGQQLINYTKWYTDFYASFPGGAISKRVLNSWTPQNTNTNIPIFEDRAVFSNNQTFNSYYMENGSYFRARNIQLAYTFKKGLLQKAGIQNLRVYIQGVNLFTITKYDGLDPAISGLDNNFGIDYGTYPFVKQFIVGANFTF